MKIPPYWSKARYPDNAGGSRDGFVAHGWSYTSLEDAVNQASLRARRVFEMLARREEPERYGYLDRPLREEIIREISDGKTLAALITRNRYGALVLNSANVLFADVDHPPVKAHRLVKWLLLGPWRREARRQELIAETTQKIEEWARDNPTRGFRLYRTLRGLRLLFTDKLYEPTSEETMTTLRALGSDPMYIKLTRQQECFRARLTAKPWRCGCPMPPNSYPWETPADQAAFHEWEREYTRVESQFRACEFIKAFGKAADIAAVKIVTATHDQLSKLNSAAPLA
ncbi:MAG: hypothetical protein K8S99_01605 [Planctomycetes bacterium]|nr:hypothetical protein [Planctomycetota bacterium]